MNTEAMANDPDQVTRFVGLFKDRPPQHNMRDLQAKVDQLDIAGQSFPITVSGRTATPNCYLCSPTVAYIDYALEETRMLDHSRVVKKLSAGAIRACAPVVRAAGLDQQVQINNWLVSTNPVPHLTPQMSKAIREICLDRYPDHAIVLRSLNDVTDAGSIEALKHAGFKMLAARQVYVMPKGTRKVSRDVKRDAAMLAQTPFDVVDGAEFSPADFARCEALYAELYLDKYTRLNPHYTAAFLQGLHDNGVMTFVGLRGDGGDLVAFSGLFESLGILTQPFVGYDTAMSQNAGLYRMVMALAREKAQARDVTLNLSAGAASFKRNRGALAAIEYTAVYVAHLPRKNRLATSILEAATQRLGIPIVQRFEL